MKSKKGTIVYIDYLRAFSMLSVVLIHVCATAITDFPNHSYSTIEGLALYFIRSICHFAVPCFFMITGALFLNPQKDISSKKIMNYVSKYVLDIVLFGWLFAIIEKVYTYKAFNYKTLLESFYNMIIGDTWNHMWYLYQLVGIMLIIPLLRVLIKSIDDKMKSYVIILFVIFLSIIPFIKDAFGFDIGFKFPVKGVYVLYLLLGYWLSSSKTKPNKTIQIVGLISVIIVIALIFIDSYLHIYGKKSFEFAAYSAPTMIILSTYVFLLFKNSKLFNTDDSKVFKIIKLLSFYSFPVYLIHMLWINIIYKGIKINPFRYNAPFSVLLIWVIVIGLSLISAYIMKKIPLLKNIF